MRFVHYTDKPFEFDGRKYLQQEPMTAFDKPNGFWITPSEGEDTWIDFCKEEQFNLDSLKVKYECRDRSH